MYWIGVGVGREDMATKGFYRFEGNVFIGSVKGFQDAPSSKKKVNQKEYVGVLKFASTVNYRSSPDHKSVVDELVM